MRTIHTPGPVEATLGRASTILRAGYRVKGPFGLRADGAYLTPLALDDPRRTAVCAEGAIVVARNVLGLSIEVEFSATSILNDAASRLGLANVGNSRETMTEINYEINYWHDHSETTLAETLQVFAVAERTARELGV